MRTDPGERGYLDSPGSPAAGDGAPARSVLNARSLTVGYGKVTVIEEFDVHIPRGGFVGIVGPNGAGKSTLLAALSGMLRPSRGTIELDGKDVTTVPAHRMRKLGVALAPEGRRVFSSLTVEETLILAHRAIASRDEGSHEEMLDRLYGIFPRLQQRRGISAGLLSGGEQQMLVLARALVVPPLVLLVDEPFLGLAAGLCADLRVQLHSFVTPETAVVVADESRKSLRDLEVSDVVEISRRTSHREPVG